ncbi:hypothetical protein [Spirosoma sp. KNUC1025]|uniref:hypothetical protein n=1 Tax=Spirosoma sp. KNUC1025 TaxID=2894082 RepID=UPI003869CF25|nr:hypothetical protein LN737_26340 [Spirosoma sp. KNUC1025]
MVRQSNGRLATFSANQVSTFGWYDDTQHKQRDFQSIEVGVPENSNHAMRAFYEVCMDGSLTVVRRLTRPHGLFKRAFGHPANYADQATMAQNTDHFDYFVHDAGHLLPLSRFYTDVYNPLMNAYDQKLQEFVITHNINTRTTIGRLILVDHYNFLVQQDARTASAKTQNSKPN